MNANLLPEDQKFDMKIDVIQGKLVAWSPIYPLSEIEL